MLRITPEIAIADWEITEQFVRASGPGGQNVNKVASAVELRFEAERSPHLPDDVKARLRRLAGRRWTNDGALLIRAEDSRSQARNREIARQRLAELVARAAERPRPRRRTHPPRAAILHRLETKRHRAAVKARRGKPGEEDG